MQSRSFLGVGQIASKVCRGLLAKICFARQVFIFHFIFSYSIHRAYISQAHSPTGGGFLFSRNELL